MADHHTAWQSVSPLLLFGKKMVGQV